MNAKKQIQKGRTTFIVGLVMLSIFMFQSAVHANQAPRNLKIWIDVSGSSPAVKNHEFAQRAGQFVASEIVKMPYGSVVSLDLFGSFDPEQNRSFRYEILHRRGQEPMEVAKKLSAFIAALPVLVSQGKINSEPETSIIGFMVKNKPFLKGSEILLVSDFLENTSELDVEKILSLSKGQLPAKPGLFSGVQKITGLGLGIGIKRLGNYELLNKLWLEFFINSGVLPGNVQFYSNKF